MEQEIINLNNKVLKLETKLQEMALYVATMQDCIENLQKITINAIRGLKS